MNKKAFDKACPLITKEKLTIDILASIRLNQLAGFHFHKVCSIYYCNRFVCLQKSQLFVQPLCTVSQIM